MVMLCVLFGLRRRLIAPFRLVLPQFVVVASRVLAVIKPVAAVGAADVGGVVSHLVGRGSFRDVQPYCRLVESC